MKSLTAWTTEMLGLLKVPWASVDNWISFYIARRSQWFRAIAIEQLIWDPTTVLCNAFLILECHMFGKSAGGEFVDGSQIMNLNITDI